MFGFCLFQNIRLKFYRLLHWVFAPREKIFGSYIVRLRMIPFWHDVFSPFINIRVGICAYAINHLCLETIRYRVFESKRGEESTVFPCKGRSGGDDSQFYWNGNWGKKALIIERRCNANATPPTTEKWRGAVAEHQLRNNGSGRWTALSARHKTKPI